MGFFGFRKPAWKHADPEIRLRAVAEIPAEQPDVLAELALKDGDPRVRAAAANRVTDGNLLTRLLKQGDDAVRRIAKERLSGVAEALLRAKALDECREVLDAVNDQKSLAELSVQARDPAVRAACFVKLSALKEPSQSLLATVAIQDADGQIALQALERLEKRSVIKDVARKAKHETVRKAAAARAESMGSEERRPSAEARRQLRRRNLETLLEEGTRLGVAQDADRAEREWQSLAGRWKEACEAEGLALEDEAAQLEARFVRIGRDLSQRAEAQRAAVAIARAEAEALVAEVATMPSAAGEDRAVLLRRWRFGDREADLKARFDAELERLFPASAVVQTAGPAPSPAIDPASEARLTTIVDEAEELGRTGGFEAKFRFQQLHKDWLSLSSGLPEEHALKQRFTTAYAAFKQRRKDERDRAEADGRQRIALLEQLAVEAEGLVSSAGSIPAEDLAAARVHGERLKDLQRRWKEVGPVRASLLQPVRDRFRRAIDAAYAPLGAVREAEDWERFARLSRAEELIAEVGRLGEEQDLSQVAGAVKRAHQRWKALGALPREKGQDAWLRFKTACDLQFERCRPWFAEQDAGRQANLDRKLALLGELEQLTAQGTVGLVGSPADLAARKAVAERVKAIQSEWKQLGPVPRARDEEVWHRYRKLCDGFYGLRRAEFDSRHQEQVANYNRKLALCVAAEELATDAEAGQQDAGRARPPQELLRNVKGLQEDWKAIGHVPREQADAIWARWRTACDRIYATLKGHFAELDAQRQASLERKLALVAELEELGRHENPHWFKEQVREAQQQWRELGHVPRDRMEEVNERFRVACERILTYSQTQSGSGS